VIKLNHTKLNLERIVFIGRAHVNLNGNRPAYLDKIMLVLRKNKALESQLL